MTQPPRHASQTVTLAQLLHGERPERESFPDEEPTRPNGVEGRAAILVGAFKLCAREDQDYLIRLAEGYAERNQKA